MMAQAMEAVVRFLAEEAVSILAGCAVSLVFGFIGGCGVLPLPSLESPGDMRQAPTVTTPSIALSQQDYDRLKKEGKLDETAQYLTT